jgi:hypothetical protein
MVLYAPPNLHRMVNGAEWSGYDGGALPGVNNEKAFTSN